MGTVEVCRNRLPGGFQMLQQCPSEAVSCRNLDRRQDDEDQERRRVPYSYGRAPHNVINTDHKPLKLYTLYGPPQHHDRFTAHTPRLMLRPQRNTSTGRQLSSPKIGLPAAQKRERAVAPHQGALAAPVAVPSPVRPCSCCRWAWSAANKPAPPEPRMRISVRVWSRCVIGRQIAVTRQQPTLRWRQPCSKRLSSPWSLLAPSFTT